MRNDVGIEEGSVVPIDYDPMLGKLIVRGGATARRRSTGSRAPWTSTRSRASRRPSRSFGELVRDADFRAGRTHTQWLDAWLANRVPAREDPTEEEVMLAAVCVTLDASEKRAAPAAAGSRWKESARSEAIRSGRAHRGGRR